MRCLLKRNSKEKLFGYFFLFFANTHPCGHHHSIKYNYNYSSNLLNCKAKDGNNAVHCLVFPTYSAGTICVIIPEATTCCVKASTILLHNQCSYCVWVGKERKINVLCNEEEEDEEGGGGVRTYQCIYKAFAVLLKH